MATKLTQPAEAPTAGGPRLDVRLNELLQSPGLTRTLLRPAEPLALPAPILPRYPELLTDDTLPADAHGGHRSQVGQLDEMKQTRQTHCYSTLNHNLGYCYDDARVIKWVLKQAARGFQGVSGSFY